MYKKITMAILLALYGSGVNAEETLELEEIQINAESGAESNLLGESPNVSDQIIQGSTLKQRATTLGDALGSELGIRSNQYGGGASAPIIRGQEGKRLKVLQNSADLLDMSTLSPDHAIMVDTTLAKQIEILRGPTSLLYASGNAAGFVNVVDNKIPSKIPQNGVEGTVGFRFNTNNHEKLTTTELTLGAGSKIAFHLEGMDRRSGNYKTPNYTRYEFKNEKALKEHLSAPQKLVGLEQEYQHWLANRHHDNYFPYRPQNEQFYIRKEEDYLRQKAQFQNAIVAPQHLDYLPNSWARSKVGSVGLSWVDDWGYLGFSYTKRKDKYALPAHNAMYENCGAYVISIASELKKPYLMSYPQLMDESDVNYINPRADCLGAEFNSNGVHTHTTAAHNHGDPYITLETSRYDLRGELNKPFTGIDKVRANFSYVDYQHQEKEGNITSSQFKNRGFTTRLEFSHQPIGNLSGVWGIQYLYSENSAYSPNTNKGRQILNDNTTKNFSLFGLEQYQWNDVTFEISARVEKQKVRMDYDLSKITSVMQPLPNRYNSPYIERGNKERAKNLANALKATKPYQETAYSYAFGAHWAFTNEHLLSFTASHQERLPNAQELYTHGMHLATNSFEVGNRNLTKEKSNNLELALKYQGNQLDYKISTYYYDFDNYIFLDTLNESLGNSRVIAPYSLRINRYNQAAAKFYGFEGQIGYQFTPVYYVSLFGDYVNGRLKHLPDTVVDYNIYTDEKTYASQGNRYTPRLPPLRLGSKIKADFNAHLSAELEYYHVFKQTHTSKFESETPGHHMLNFGLSYQNTLAQGEYEIFFKANNLLNQQVYAHETYLSYIPQMGRNFSFGVNYRF